MTDALEDTIRELASPLARRDPYPFYRRLRENAPVHRVGAHWVLTRHRDCAALLSDVRWSQLPEGETMCLPDRRVELAETDPEPVGGNDQPHNPNYLRRFLAKQFAPPSLQRIQLRVQDAVDSLLEPAVEARAVDFVEAFANPLPAYVMCELLDVPRSDRSTLAGWATALVRRLDLAPMTPSEVEHETKARSEFRGYFGSLVADRQKKPGADLLSSLLAFEAEGRRLTEEQLLDACIVIMLAGGFGAPADFLALGVLALAEHAEERLRLHANPELVPTAVDELLRYDGPSQILTRLALQDVEIGGHSIRRGETAHVLIGAANRDPDAFSDPDRLNLARRPNPHLQFGYGHHSCGGVSLARLEMRVAFASVASRAPNLELAGEPEWKPTISSRGLTALPVSFG